MKGLMQLVFGLVVWIVVLYTLTFPSWWKAVIQLLQGGVVFVLFFIGLGLILLGMSELRG